jgi:poly-gamma-glutamate capsule biosynthesis protein CapA/YwtB (metallophosphatase superfamily)
MPPRLDAEAEAGHTTTPRKDHGPPAPATGVVTAPVALRLFLCGDVMTGRGVDQALPHPGDPRIHESYLRSAEMYVRLAEDASGPIPRPVDFSYIWGDALEELAHARPDARIINLETSITRSDDHWRGKGINYRMHPRNAPCLTAARIDCCVLANNHVLDYGYPGLLETIETIEQAGLAAAGAGRTLAQAQAPAVIEAPGQGRVLVFAFGAESSGIPRSWAAAEDRPGVNLLEDLSDRTVDRITNQVRAAKRPGDVVVASIHWGDNWGFDVPDAHVRFARGLVREGVDLVHGHSSHHVRPIERFRDKLILYGCGDFLNDYEGISGYEEFRGDLAQMYFPDVDPATGRLLDLVMTPMRIRRFRANRAPRGDAEWLRDTINRESRRFGVQVELGGDNRLRCGQGPGSR